MIVKSAKRALFCLLCQKEYVLKRPMREKITVGALLFTITKEKLSKACFFYAFCILF
jgi:hypothetical protein